MSEYYIGVSRSHESWVSLNWQGLCSIAWNFFYSSHRFAPSRGAKCRFAEMKRRIRYWDLCRSFAPETGSASSRDHSQGHQARACGQGQSWSGSLLAWRKLISIHQVRCLDSLAFWGADEASSVTTHRYQRSHCYWAHLSCNAMHAPDDAKRVLFVTQIAKAGSGGRG